MNSDGYCMPLKMLNDSWCAKQITGVEYAGESRLPGGEYTGESRLPSGEYINISGGLDFLVVNT